MCVTQTFSHARSIKQIVITIEENTCQAKILFPSKSALTILTEIENQITLMTRLRFIGSEVKINPAVIQVQISQSLEQAILIKLG